MACSAFEKLGAITPMVSRRRWVRRLSATPLSSRRVCAELQKLHGLRVFVTLSSRSREHSMNAGGEHRAKNSSFPRQAPTAFSICGYLTTAGAFFRRFHAVSCRCRLSARARMAVLPRLHRCVGAAFGGCEPAAMSRKFILPHSICFSHIDMKTAVVILPARNARLHFPRFPAKTW